ncbi:Helicase, SNF2/RAD54 family [Richelia intracellularis HH01]|uniref:Helicase, SNF2/RAD54 family n=1 Tax=Richelia intracellularis HH01 TaxID=1165094 RepID=M1X5M9_9NOST|nr:DEAD/DEAH box helicase [Richelia intracellularis]CCH67491.1 Helicase, SNF2/RAD54 family [Richelia intracellularis HH01]
MAILHGSWLINNRDNGLFIWAETWRYLKPSLVNCDLKEIQKYPFLMSAESLRSWLESEHPKLAKSIFHAQHELVISQSKISPSKTENANSSIQSVSVHPQIIALPTTIQEKKGKNLSVLPLYYSVEDKTETMPYLQPWLIWGFVVQPLSATSFLSSLPLNITAANNFIGGDLLFWSQIARWSLDLIARSKFLPAIERGVDGFANVKWQVLLDSALDSTRLEKFVKQMPLGCRTYQRYREGEKNVSPFSVHLPIEPQKLILDFLCQIIDSQIRSMVGSQNVLDPKAISILPETAKKWLQGLTGNNHTFKEENMEWERLEAILKSWTIPVKFKEAGINQFRTCFRLKPPELEERYWRLEYLLQAADNPEFLVDAETIWQNPQESFIYKNRTIKKPQETFLQGLGLASRLYVDIIPSLEEFHPLSCQINSMQAYEFIKSIAWRFEYNGLGVILPPSLSHKQEEYANHLGLKITADNSKEKLGKFGLNGLLAFKWQLTVGGQELSEKEFNKLVALNSPLVEINGEWIELKSQDIKTVQDFFASGKQKKSLSLEDAVRFSSGDTKTLEKLPIVSFEASGTLKDLLSTLVNDKALKTLSKPVNFQGELRPYQERGVAWLVFLESWGLGACLADDMGLGKTIQLIAFLLHLQERKLLKKPTLLICPTSVLGNWEREVRKFAPKLKTLQHHGDKRPKGKEFIKAVNQHDLIITSYSLVHRDLKLLQGVEWHIIALDEAQNVKNPEAKQSKAIRQLKAIFKVALTGTPVENRLQELWSILDFLNPGYLGDRQFFQRRFVMPIEKYGDTASLNQLRSLVKPFILRRLKTDQDIIKDLPKKQEVNVFCKLSFEQAQLYQQVVDSSFAEIKETEGLKRQGMVLALLVKLKQICNHPGQYLKQKQITEPQLSGKLLRLQDLLEELLLQGHSSLIFTQFAEWGKLLQLYLKKRLRQEILFLYGSTRKNQREEMVDRFQHDPQGPPIMILSIRAGGVGLNLTRANHVFHFDRWWNPAVENQATDRVFRIGQKRNVQVHKFICTGTLEEKIHDMLEGKKQLAEHIVNTGEDWLADLDTDQLRNLLVLDRDAIISSESEE